MVVVLSCAATCLHFPTLMEQEIHRIWILVSELSDQLAQNNRVAAELHAQIQTLKACISSWPSAFFSSVDLAMIGTSRCSFKDHCSSPIQYEPEHRSVHGLLGREAHPSLFAELFDSELERSTVGLIIENQGFLQENKQLTSLMTDYEQTLRTVMSKFQQYVVSESDIPLLICSIWTGSKQQRRRRCQS
jgi:hypothetical protein